jgi:hypothetical protein
MEYFHENTNFFREMQPFTCSMHIYETNISEFYTSVYLHVRIIFEHFSHLLHEFCSTEVQSLLLYKH